MFVAFSGAGGVEKMVCGLLRGLAEQTPESVAIDLVAVRARAIPVGELPERVRVVDIGTDHTTFAFWRVASYLRRYRPEVMLVAKERAIRTAVIAARLARVRLRLIGWQHTTLSTALAEKSALTRRFRLATVKRYYPQAERIVCVSEGVAADLRRLLAPRDLRCEVIHNPVIEGDPAARAQADVSHPWFGRDFPILVAAGRLTRQKDFPTLVRAVAALRERLPVRLLILGDGNERPALQTLIDELGLQQWVDLVGHVNNPYTYMARAQLFVLSSAWEGSPTVLTEALAIGVPVVATDCPSGPKETLENGRYGPLVTVGDAEQMAAAIERTLAEPLPADTLRAAVADYTVSRSAARFRELLGV